MKPNQPTHPLPDFDADLEDDVVWNLIDDASPADPPPRFVEETLRRVRLEEDKQKSQWWKLIFAPKPLIGTAGVALATIVIVISLPSDPSPSNRTIWRPHKSTKTLINLKTPSQPNFFPERPKTPPFFPMRRSSLFSIKLILP
jgi:hypothetical protein